MPTIKSLEDQARALVDQQDALVKDTRPWSQKQSEWDNRDKDIKAVLAQHKALREVDRDPFAAAHDPGRDGTMRHLKGVQAGLVAQGYPAVSTPQLDLQNDDVRDLYEAAVSHKNLSVTSRDFRNATDTTSIPPAALPDYRLPPVTVRREPTRVLSLIPTFQTDHPSVTWYTTTGTAAAAAVAEGGTKPTSTIAYTAVTGTVTKIAHVVEVTDETLADFPAFLGVLQQDMVDGLIKTENDELLNATVTGAHKFVGLLGTSGILTRARTTEPYLDAISLAMDDLRTGTSFTQPDGMVMNPTTWGLLRRLKDSNNQYYLQPQVTDNWDPNIWGVPVVLSTQIAAGTVLIGDFANSTAAYVREGIRVETANQGSTQFVANTTLVRAEERLLLTAPRPTGLVKLTGMS